MKAREFLENFGGKQELVEWNCPKCGSENLPDEECSCPECGYKMPERMYDEKVRKYYEGMYQKVFSRMKGKLFETDLVGANTVRFTNTLCKYGVLRRLRNGRFVEVLKIPKEFVIECFVNNDMKKLREMAWRRKRKQKKEYHIRPYQKL